MQSLLDAVDPTIIDQPIEFTPLTGAFIQLNDLIEVLQDYYRGKLDEPRDIADLTLDLIYWHSNSLWCQVDSQQLDRLLRSLPKYQRQAIRYQLHDHNTEIESLEQVYALSSGVVGSFGQFIDQVFAEAVEALSEMLLKELL